MEMTRILISLVTISAFLVILTFFGNIFCKWVLATTHVTPLPKTAAEPGDSELRRNTAGRWIGAIERLIIAIGIALSSTEIIAAVVAVKAISRFQQMDNKDFAEYVLLGSLCSVLWAIVWTVITLAIDATWGANLIKLWLPQL
jgi:hypothetical protein